MEKILIKYLQDDYTEEDVGKLNEWLSEKEDNRREFFSFVAILKSGRLKRYSDPVFIQAEKEKLRERIRKEKEKRNARPTYRNRFLQYVAIAAVVIGIATALFRFSAGRSVETVVAGQEEVKQIELHDGTKVWLNKSARLEYPEKFEKNNRTVHFQGEGYFEVAEDAKRPFIVKTQRMEVTVIGTKFNLNCTKDENVSVVILLEGKVKVKGTDGEGVIALSPGQKAELNLLTHKLQVRESENSWLEMVWHDGLIPFRRASIKEIGKILEQLYPVKVHVDTAVSGTTTYSGKLKSQDSIDTVLRFLKYSIPLEYEIKENDVYIRNR
jgi:ferric-dicitrate binding protein FerR (iron transport regulator)